jgi:hypothetical protein
MYLEKQTLPNYVKDFLEDGKASIEAYRPMRSNFLDKKVVFFFSVFSILVIGGSFIFCLYIYPRIYPFDNPGGKTISKLVRPYIFKAISFADKGQFEKACLELKRACELGECEYNETKKRGGVCQ